MLSENKKVSKIMKQDGELTEVKDIDMLPERFIREAYKLVDADAGSICMNEGNKLKLSYTQNDTNIERRLY